MAEGGRVCGLLLLLFQCQLGSFVWGFHCEESEERMPYGTGGAREDGERFLRLRASAIRTSSALRFAIRSRSWRILSNSACHTGCYQHTPLPPTTYIYI